LISSPASWWKGGWHSLGADPPPYQSATTPTDAIGFDEHCPPGAIAHEQILVSRASRCA